MAATNQSQAIQVANAYFAAASDLMAAYQRVVALGQQWTDESVANTLNALSTAALNADGTLGTADGTPNNTHPIDTRIYTALQHAVSANQIASVKTVEDAFVTLINGSAVSAQVGARGILNSVIGG